MWRTCSRWPSSVIAKWVDISDTLSRMSIIPISTDQLRVLISYSYYWNPSDLISPVIPIPGQ